MPERVGRVSKINAETLLLREKERVAETEGRLTVQVDPELLREEGHRLACEDDETDQEYAARSMLFACTADPSSGRVIRRLGL